MHRQRCTTLPAIALLMATVLTAQQAPWCRLVPQIQSPPAIAEQKHSKETGIPSHERVIEISSSNLSPSVQYRLDYARPEDLVVVNPVALENPAARKALKNSKALLVMKTTQTGDVAQSIFSRPIAEMRILAAVPKDADGVANTYRASTASFSKVVEQYASVAREFDDLPNAKVLSQSTSRQSIRATLLSAVSEKNSRSLLVIVAHNEEGILKLPDGSSLTLTDLSDASSRSQRPLIIFSCDTLEGAVTDSAIVTTRAVFFQEILDALRPAASSLLHSQNGSRTFGEIVRGMNAALDSRMQVKKWKIAAAAILSVSAVALIVIVIHECDSKQQNCK